MFLLAFAIPSALALGSASAATVFAHFMIQNAYAYDINQWKTDIAAAQQIGIDGFALNWIPPDCEEGLDWMVERIDDAFTAAEQMGYQLIYSFDMSYSSCNIHWNQTFMQSMISRYSDYSSAYRWNSNILVSTYGGDQSEQYGNEFFQGLKDNMQYANNAITLAPALTTYSMGAQAHPLHTAASLMSDYPSIDGFFNWQAWPLNVRKNISVSPDLAFQSSLKNSGRTGPYIMSVSPWQYKDLDNGDELDSWVAYSDTLFSDRFAQITSKNAILPDIIELLTWNDFCESHYLRDLPSQNESATDYVELSDMSSYVYGQDHSPWRIMAKYYISWWKMGSPPPITQDQLVYWYRVHPKATICTGGASSTIRNHMFPSDAMFAWALVSSPTTISMSIGTNQFWTFEADGSGPAMGFIPFPSYVPESGITPQVAIMRDGKVVQEGNGSVPISSACAWQNFNPVVNLAGPGLDG